VREFLLDLIRNMKKPRQNLAQYQANVRGHQQGISPARSVAHATAGPPNLELRDRI